MAVTSDLGMTKNYHIMPQDDRWVVKSEGSSRAVSLHGTKAEALAAARLLLARSKKTELVVHDRNGRIQDMAHHAGSTLVKDQKTAPSRRSSILDLKPLSLGAILQPLNSRADLEAELWPDDE